MGSFSRAMVCELVGLYLLNIQESEFNGENIRFVQRDDGLSLFDNTSGPESKTITNICKIFKDNSGASQLQLICILQII